MDYWQFRALMGEEDKTDDIFVGYKSDGKLHLLGHRPTGMSIYFSENECTSLDLGIVTLPDGRDSVEDLVEGDMVTVQPEDGKSYNLIFKGNTSKSSRVTVRLV